MINNSPQNSLQDPAVRLKRKNAFDGSLVCGTSKFNRDTGRVGATSKPFVWAIDPETSLIRSDMVRARCCPICDHCLGHTLFVKDGFPHVKCSECGLIYVNSILRDEVVAKFWREEIAWSGVLNSELQVNLDNLKYCYGLELVEPRLTGRTLLDVGSGPGGFVRQASEKGWQATALELNVESSRKLADDGFTVIDTDLETSDLQDSSFDLISFWEALEHLTEPKSVLTKAHQLLASDGLLFILVPNASSLVTRLLHDQSNTFGGHSHVNHFTAQTLTKLLELTGFEVVEMETVITELGTINNYLAFEDPYQGEAATFWEELTPELIHKNMWGSRLLAVACKK